MKGETVRIAVRSAGRAGRSARRAVVALLSVALVTTTVSSPARAGDEPAAFITARAHAIVGFFVAALHTWLAVWYGSIQASLGIGGGLLIVALALGGACKRERAGQTSAGPSPGQAQTEPTATVVVPPPSYPGCAIAERDLRRTAPGHEDGE